MSVQDGAGPTLNQSSYCSPSVWVCRVNWLIKGLVLRVLERVLGPRELACVALQCNPRGIPELAILSLIQKTNQLLSLFLGAAYLKHTLV